MCYGYCTTIKTGLKKRGQKWRKEKGKEEKDITNGVCLLTTTYYCLGTRF